MHRRLFLQFPLIASALVTQGQTAAQQSAEPQGSTPQQPAKTSIPHPPPKKGFKIEGGKDRYQEELLIMGGQTDRKVSSRDPNAPRSAR